MRTRFFDSIDETSDYFNSLNGYYLKFSNLFNYLKILDDYKYGNKDIVLSVCQNFKVDIKGVDMINVNNTVFITIEIFRNYYVYAITEPKPYVPEKRNVSAYVFRMLKSQTEDYSYHQIQVDRMSQISLEDIELG